MIRVFVPAQVHGFPPSDKKNKIERDIRVIDTNISNVDR
jgi:hypothetical protein